MRLAAAAAGLVLWGGCGGSGTGEMQMSVSAVAVPPIDREAPARLETATFALG
ncbi:MAG TPA: hypothetical protein VEJ18_20355 [Planctomycetota bacterium]|nr:hypothetical protein [Planctomycetota bacterium]